MVAAQRISRTIQQQQKHYEQWRIQDFTKGGKGWASKVRRSRRRRRRRWACVGRGLPSCWEWGLERGHRPPENVSIFWMKMACSDTVWHTVLKLMCLQHKVSHQTFMHCACKFFVKNYGMRREGASPNTSRHPKYATDYESSKFGAQIWSITRTNASLTNKK